jgi:hemoglobin-like flavoprotein
VIESWENLRRVKDYEQVAGTLLYQRFFKRCPDGKTLFGFMANADPDINSKHFKSMAAFFIQMLDSSLEMLGPDIDLLTDVMLELGKRHVNYGVPADMYPIMGECLVETMEEVLSNKVMTERCKAAWTEVYAALTTDMMAALEIELDFASLSKR